MNEQGYREVLAVESAAGERKEAYRSLLKGLLERGLHGVQLVISDDHDSIKAAVQTELPSARWQRCIAHFERNVLSQVPTSDMAEVAADLKGIFAVHRRESADALVAAFAERHRRRFPKAVATLETGIADALTFLAFPTSHQRLLRTANGLERLFGEAKRRTRVIGIFPNQKSADNLCTAVLLRATEEWALKRYLDMQPLHAMNREEETKTNQQENRGQN